MHRATAVVRQLDSRQGSTFTMARLMCLFRTQGGRPGWETTFSSTTTGSNILGGGGFFSNLEVDAAIKMMKAVNPAL